MKRFITYLFTYENGVKGKNVGFIRTDERNELLDMEIHVQGIGRFQGMGQIYILLKGEKMWGVQIGEIPVGQGRGVARVKYGLQDVRGEGLAYDEAAGVAIRFGGQYYAASCWMEKTQEEIISNHFAVWQKEISDTEQNPEPEQSPESQQSPEPQQTPMPEPSPKLQPPPEKTLVQEELAMPEEKEPKPQPDGANAQSELVRLAEEKLKTDSSCENRTDSDQAAVRMRKLDLSDIRKLPKKNWYLCNNSFLIHGFFNYHYLVLIESEENGGKKSYLGVPGIYEKPERLMAMLFGFGDFRPEAEIGESDPEGKFGYWVCLLDM